MSILLRAQAGAWRSWNLRLSAFICGSMLGLPQVAMAEDPKPEAPQGYEDAPVADAAAPAFVPDAKVTIANNVDVDLDEKVDPQVLNLEKQYLPQFQPILKGELSLIPRVCELSNEQRQEIAKAGDHGLKVALRKYAKVQHQMRHGGGRRVNGQRPSLPDPYKLIREELAKSVRESLPVEQADRYQAEIDKRAAHRKRTGVLNLVAQLDERLVLNARQREELIDSLSSNWQDAWAQSLQMFMQNNQYLPKIPDEHIVPLLNETQQKVWRGTQKNNHVYWGNIYVPQGLKVVDDLLSEEAEE